MVIMRVYSWNICDHPLLNSSAANPNEYTPRFCLHERNPFGTSVPLKFVLRTILTLNVYGGNFNHTLFA